MTVIACLPPSLNCTTKTTLMSPAYVAQTDAYVLWLAADNVKIQTG